MRTLFAIALIGAAAAAWTHDGEAVTLDERVASHVTPLREAIAEERSRVHLRDAAAGIGYIIGLAGIVAYVKSKPRPAS